MTEIPIKTRQRILRKARLFLAYGQADFICEALSYSYPKIFKPLKFKAILKYFPEILSREPEHETDVWFTDSNAKQERINLLSDDINELNQKIKEESCPAGSGMDQSKRSSARREKISYSTR